MEMNEKQTSESHPIQKNPEAEPRSSSAALSDDALESVTGGGRVIELNDDKKSRPRPRDDRNEV